VLWIHFFVNAPLGIALGFDLETPGLMNQRPRPRGQSVVTRGLLVTSVLVGLVMAIANLVLLEVGKQHYGSLLIGSSIGLVAFVLMLVVAAYECRSERESILTPSTFDSAKMNWTALAEVIGALLLTQGYFLPHLLGATRLTAAQWCLGPLAAVALLLTWEVGKWIARRRSRQSAVLPLDTAEMTDPKVVA
jgi:Ca2+-transporting ATPase